MTDQKKRQKDSTETPEIIPPINGTFEDLLKAVVTPVKKVKAK